MKFVFAPITALVLFATVLAAQSAPPPSTSASQQPPAQSQPQPQQSNGKVIFSRSTDENGQTTTTIGEGAATGTNVNAPTASDMERDAVTFASYDLDVHLEPAKNGIAVRAVMKLRNDGKAPLAHLPLEISSTLKWERIEVAGKDMPFTVATLQSDTDHTGQLHEAAITLAAPLAAGATVEVVASYSGIITPSAQRLLALGTPDEIALHSDWDTIGLDFTGLRGFGNVVWYPVAAEPVILGDGARLFDEVGEVKQRNANARFRLRLTDEFPHSEAPAIALVNGESVALNIVDPPNPVEEMQGVATADTGATTLGFTAPSLFVAQRTAHEATSFTLWTANGDEGNLENWTTAAAAVSLFVAEWLGAQPRNKLTVLDLPDAGDAPFESGALLAIPASGEGEDQLERVLAHALTYAWLPAPQGKLPQQPIPAWLGEGVANFMGTLWIEKQSGRTRAMESLESSRGALALAEPQSPGESPGQPLAQADAPAYYRTKAAYVLWMLRDMVGDEALAAALRDYYSALATGKPANFEGTLEGASHKDLSWFFADWVDADKGLPDLAIDGVFPEAAQAGNTLVAVDVANSGYASVEVPVTVSTASGPSATHRLIVPGRGKATVRILVLGKPTGVQVNDGTIPETEATVHIRNLVVAESSSAQPPDAPQ
ncbi:MAG TPA: hypothetical protein VL986_04650 [Terracidiphilus sp.]|nr:hypothetical protein [Terracidiphilus sp.]